MFGLRLLWGASWDKFLRRTDVGWAVSGGVEFKLKLLRISPELRYMRFGDFACDRCTNAIPSLAVNPVVVMLGWDSDFVDGFKDG